MVMKYKYWLVGLVFLLGTSTVMAADEFSEWNHWVSIKMEGDSPYKAVYLTEEVYQYALTNLNDLRIVDNLGQQVPYYIQGGSTLQQKNEIVINAQLKENFQQNDTTYFDYLISTSSTDDPIGNKLVFSLPNQNFLRHIEVYGSYDGHQWTKLTKDDLYWVDGRQKNEVLLGEDKKFHYYRIGLLDNADTISLGKMDLILSHDSSQWASYKRVMKPEFKVENQKRETVITISNPHKLKIRRFIFDITGNFQRKYSVYRETQETAPLQVGELYSLSFAGKDLRSKEISFKKSLDESNIVIKIQNQDDRPLVIHEIQAEYDIDKLVFPDLGNQPYRLYFGNSKAKQPNYELQLQKNYIEKEKQDLCTLQAVEQNEQSKPDPVIQGNLIFDVVIALVAFLLIALIVPKLNLHK